MESLRKYLADHPEDRPVIPRGPGLGLGGRMGAIASTSAMLAIRELGIEAAAIQCSVFRELRPDFLGEKPVTVEYKGIGRVPVGHTGMTIRGQFLESMAERIRLGISGPFVSDADHIPLEGDARENIERFRGFIQESRERTFFTLDPHFCMDNSATSPADKFRKLVPAVEKAASILAETKRGEPYVIELSVDEAPGITTVEEMTFLAKRLATGGIPLFSIAPAIGFNKKDEDTDEMRRALQGVLPALNRVALDHGLVLGIHSGDGKSEKTLRAIGELTGGNIWYKVSPDRQRLFLWLLAGTPEGSEERELFKIMYKTLLGRVREGAKSSDAELAANSRLCIEELERSGGTLPSADNRMFHDFGFILAREFKPRLDSLGENFRRLFYSADAKYIRSLAECLGLPRRRQ
jgi:hypothetical protein